ncbi:MAG: hypothetical protein KC619_20945, partial [Myxococcales bacterium]|nr:hypothetical protein [Myxococcales bacterium]
MARNAPSYRPRACFRTRRSASERVALDPARDFGATALDRPRIDVAKIRPPRRRGRSAPPHWLERPGAIGRLITLVI